MRWDRGRAALVAIALAAMAAGLGSCDSTAPRTGTPSAPNASASVHPSATSSGDAGQQCSTDAALGQVRALFAGQTFEAHYLTIAGDLTISIWFVDPQLDPLATADTLAANNRKAVERAVSIAYDVVHRAPCATKVFAKVNPMIVDRAYQNWYINFIPVGVLTATENPTTDQLIAAVESGTEGPGSRRAAPRPVNATAGCSWADARRRIDPILTGSSPTPNGSSTTTSGSAPGNTVGYLIIGGSLVPDTRWIGASRDDVGVEVQWSVASPGSEGDSAILERLGRLAEALSCYSPRLDSLEAFIVDPHGNLVAYGRVPGALIQPHAVPLPPSLVKIDRYPVP